MRILELENYTELVFFALPEKNNLPATLRN